MFAIKDMRYTVLPSVLANVSLSSTYFFCFVRIYSLWKAVLL